MAENPLVAAAWMEVLRPVRQSLLPALQAAFHDRQRSDSERSLAAGLLAEYAANRPDVLAKLTADADGKRFALLLAALGRLGDKASAALRREFARDCEAAAGLAALDPSWGQPPRESVQEIEAADGIFNERWAFCQTMPLEKFVPTAESLRAAGYRPAWFQPYALGKTARIAAVWDRDGPRGSWLPRPTTWKSCGLTKNSAHSIWFPPALRSFRKGPLAREAARSTWRHGPARPTNRAALTPAATIGPGPTAAPLAVPWTVRFYGWSSTRPDEPPADWNAVVKSKILHEHKASSLDFDWGSGPPDAAVPAKYFAVVATAEVEMEGGKYYFCTASQDGIRVFVNDKSVLDNWGACDDGEAYGAYPRSRQALAAGGVLQAGHRRRTGSRSFPRGARAAAAPARSETRPAGRSFPPESTTVQRCRNCRRPTSRHFGSCSCPSVTARGPCRSKTALRESSQPSRSFSSAPVLSAASDRPRFGRRRPPWPSSAWDTRRKSGRFCDTARTRACGAALSIASRSLGVDPAAVVRRIEEEKDVSARRALLLLLGEFGPDRLPAGPRDALVPKLLSIYRDDPDPGIHGEAEWLLRRWKQQDGIRLVNRQLASAKAEGKRQWYVNGQGQTMVTISGPVEFVMGAPVDEPAHHHQPDYAPHRQRIDHAFAISAKEVTVAQFTRFMPDVNHIQAYRSPEPDCPVMGIPWYGAAYYCNWLSSQEGIPEDQWCYEPNPADVYANGMKLADGWWKRTGYRLPSEAEWEYACRSGAATARYYGRAEELLGKYAWYGATTNFERAWPVGSLKPNDFGLFDMLGNAAECCQERYVVDYARYRENEKERESGGG